MWRSDTFDPLTIERELGWARDLGFNSIRVFLHDLVWRIEPSGFFDRMEVFLTLAQEQGLGTMFVLFDGCWDPYPTAGVQRPPRPHTHNSGWAQGPGLEILREPARHDELEPYIRDTISRFQNDPRVHAWDLFNEPDNCSGAPYKDLEPEHKAEMAGLLLAKTFSWARDVRPLQPLTSALWRGTWNHADGLSAIEQLQIERSDVISFHHYGRREELDLCLRNLSRYERPILCTEFMARHVGSTIGENLPILKEHGVAAYCWGFVSGKTQTVYPWDSWSVAYTEEPAIWFHDLLRTDGTPYDAAEIEAIRRFTRPS
jgi:hypothetical protein